MSIPKAVAMLGLGRANLRLIPVDDEHADRGAGAGTAIAAIVRLADEAIALCRLGVARSPSGAIDPLAELADVARRATSLWFHVDGAYGAARRARAAPEKFVGMSRADSISLDAHKWLYQPLDCSVAPLPRR